VLIDVLTYYEIVKRHNPLNVLRLEEDQSRISEVKCAHSNILCFHLNKPKYICIV